MRFSMIEKDERQEVAEFVKKCVALVLRITDIRECVQRILVVTLKARQTSRDYSLARAADMGADTKIKQELLSELDEMKM